MERSSTPEIIKHPLVIDGMFAARRTDGYLTEAVFTDRDGTWEVGGKITPDQEVAAASQAIFDGGVASNRPTIIVTGRPTRDTEQEIQEGGLQPFAAIIGAVGTEISYRRADGTYERDETYHDLLARKFDRKVVATRGVQLIQKFARRAPEIGLNFQKPELEEDFLRVREDGLPTALGAQVEEFKVSFDFTTYTPETTVEEVREMFENAYPGLHVVISEEARYGDGWPEGLKKFFLDVVPATKRDAIDYIMKTKKVGLGYMMGDSGNDVDALANTRHNVLSILVGDCREEAYKSLQRHILERRERERLPSQFHRLEGSEESLRTHVMDMLLRKSGEKLLYVGSGPEERGSLSFIRVAEILGDAALRKRILRSMGVRGRLPDHDLSRR